MNPYLDLELGDGTIHRYFDEEVDEWDLIWHCDEHDRRVTIKESKGWSIQFDNEMPTPLEEGDEVYIKAMKYHRLLKGDGPLQLIIQEFNKYNHD